MASDSAAHSPDFCDLTVMTLCQFFNFSQIENVFHIAKLLHFNLTKVCCVMK